MHEVCCKPSIPGVNAHSWEGGTGQARQSTCWVGSRRARSLRPLSNHAAWCGLLDGGMVTALMSSEGFHLNEETERLDGE